MTQAGEQRGESPQNQNGKRKYEPPDILSQTVFETTALACGKRPAQGGACAVNKKNS